MAIQLLHPVVLVGMRGAGKTVVAQELAAWLSLQRHVEPTPVVDLDATIEKAAGKSVADIWATFGERMFRRLEVGALGTALELKAVVATGGGLVESPEARAALHPNAAYVVYLRATPATLLQRLGNTPDPTRPQLTSLPWAEEIAFLVERRAEWYAAVASRTVDVDDLSVEAIAQEIGQKVPLREAAEGNQ